MGVQLKIRLGVSLNPTDRQIREKDLATKCKRTGKTPEELYPNPGQLEEYLNRPLNKLKFYQRTAHYSNNHKL